MPSSASHRRSIQSTVAFKNFLITDGRTCGRTNAAAASRKHRARHWSSWTTSLRENYARSEISSCTGVLRGQGQQRPGDRADVLPGWGQFRRRQRGEFLTVHENVKDLPEQQRQNFIWDRVIYANPIKATGTLEQLDPYKPLVTYDNYEEVIKIARHAPHAGLVLRLRVPNTGSMVELSSKFGALPGEAVDLIAFARNNKLEVEG